MAPITRSSVHGRQSQLDDHQTQEESPPPEDDYEDQEMPDEEGEESGQEGAAESSKFSLNPQDVMEFKSNAESSMLIDTTDAQSPYQSSAQEMLRPLQDTAERVSRQVEEFAKALDRFVSTREPTDNVLWDDALVLLERYGKIAEIRRAKTPDAEGEGELDKLGLEADIWILVRNLLYTNSPRNLDDVQIAQESRLAGLHRYSTNTELWMAFLDSDAVAQEYENILSWLQDRAATNSRSIEQITGDLMDRSSRGDGIWSSGPIFTQSKIKQQKRARVWSMPLEPANPGLNRTHVRESDSTRLVTQLDPDCRTRESAVFEDEDEYWDQATWQAYWEMLRRGYSNADIRAWFAERRMLWKYTALCGCGTSSKQMADSPWVRILNLATNTEWLERCRNLAHNPAIEDHFQRAVYGVLCGDFGASKSASNDIDDHLFAIFNSLLIQRYQHYLQASRDKSSQPTTGYRPAPPSTEKIRQYLSVQQSDPSFKEEVHLPHKLVELAVMSKDFDNLLITMGRAAAHVAYATGQGHDLMRESDTDEEELASLNARDPDCIRVVAHLQLLLRSLGMLESAYADYEYELENNLAAYIGLLETLGRWLLIPLYASKLSKERSHHVLGAILINVTDRRERDLQVKLMKQYNINVSEVAYSIFSLANYTDLQKLRRYEHGPIPAQITKMGGTGKIAQHKVIAGLMSGDLSEDDEKAVTSVEWVRYVDAENWHMASWSVGVVYKVFLLEGNFVALRQLLERVRLSEMSLAAVGMNLQFSDADPPTSNVESEVDEVDEDRVKPIGSPNRKRKSPNNDHSARRAKTDRQTLALYSLAWKQLEQLVAAIDALDVFQETADILEANNKTNPSLARTYKRDLKAHLDEVRQTMTPLLDNDFLSLPSDDNEALILTDIRNHYIPEIILAYNSALWFAGHYISRSWLVECMTLAQTVAETNMLTGAFVASGRMKELVRAFAVDSEALLLASEQKSGVGEKAKVWNVTWRET
ncbi:Nucleoporin nup84 [Cladophialophora chaetospira]|uniref:Nuclear pore complex protein n=1 Tax=Cladophialophora chaetospira TaxID=386627 RepID=A0AA39CJ52_9EURO|nr:Nucleoporin nup84 [Cladophialophora chaetospira]